MKKRTLFGQMPEREDGSARAPLPLVTQAMAAVSPDELMAGETMTAGTTLNGPGVQALQRVRAQTGSPLTQVSTEVGLTQHTLPEGKQDARLALINASDSEQAASFRVLRHHLLDGRRPQVILVSSPRAAEGKTTTAVNLALALAECGRAKVLLIDGHFRNPQIAKLFGFVPPWCFAEQLATHRHQPMLPWSLIEISQLWLHVAGISDGAAKQQLVDAPAFGIAIERLRAANYDHIVIDGPSVLGGAEVNLIQDACDGIVLSLRSGTSTARDLRAAIQQITPARVLGSVLHQ